VTGQPLSFMQERLWFIDRLEPNSSLYNITRAFRVRGHLDRDAFRFALDAVVARHETLRTTFHDVDGKPAQAIAPAGAADYRPLTWEASVAASANALSEAIATEAHRPFDLRRDPMLRVVHATAGDHEYLVISMHHIVSDGWSLGILFRELAEFYEARLQGRPARMSPLRSQYKDYARSQRDLLQGNTLDRLGDYWRKALQSAPPIIALPTDRPRPARQSYGGARILFTLPSDLTAALQDLARRERATLFMTTMAALHVLLYRYSGQCDVLIGTPIANRTTLDTEALIGFFANTLVLRGQVSEDISFRDLLRQMRTTAIGAYGHQEMPFEKLVELMRPERSLSHAPLFQVLLAFQNVPMDDLVLRGAALESIRVPVRTSKFDFHLSLREREGEIDGIWEYSTDLFDAATADRMR